MASDGEEGPRLGLQVLLRVGYDPEIVSELVFLPRGVARTVGCGGVAGAAGRSCGTAFVGGSSVKRQHNSPCESATPVQEPKVRTEPSANFFISTEVQMVTIESNRGDLEPCPTVGAKVSTIYGSAVNLGVTQVLDL